MEPHQTVLMVAVLTLIDPASTLYLPIKSVHYPCGQPEIEPVASRIVGGQEAIQGSWPWMVQLLHENHFVCGGAIINERFVLTAAHCFSKRSNNSWTALAGKHRIDRTEASQESRKVGKFIVHEDFSVNTFENDIALIYLTEPFTFSSTIRPVCLPGIDRGVPTGTMCLIAGWGDTRGTGTEATLNQVEVPVINDKVCSDPGWYGPDFLGEKTLCAGYEQGGKDACQGDSGGPLICKDGASWVVQGIASWGIECGVSHWPGIYTQVVTFTDWIHQHIQAFNQ